MSVRRRRIKERVERDRIRSESSARASHSLECMRRAIDDAIARGDNIITPRTTRDMRRHPNVSMSDYIQKDEPVYLAPETPMEFLVGDIVTRDGTDEHEVIQILPGDNCMTVRCIKPPDSGWASVGDEEFNLIRRYDFVRRSKRLSDSAGTDPRS